MKKSTTALKTLLLCAFLSLFNCKNEVKNEGPNFIPRDSYSIYSHNGKNIYRDNTTKNVMDGYYIVGDSSKKWEEFTVKQGVLYGDYIVYHNNGKTFTHSKYYDGQLHGEDLQYYMSGKLKKFSAYNKGIQYGKVIEYYEGGQVRSESRKKNDEIVSSMVFDENGNLTSKISVKNNLKTIKTYKDGKILSEDIVPYSISNTQITINDIDRD